MHAYHFWAGVSERFAGLLLSVWGASIDSGHITQKISTSHLLGCGPVTGACVLRSAAASMDRQALAFALTLSADTLFCPTHYTGMDILLFYPPPSFCFE